MPNGKGKGEWILIDSREIDEPERTKYWDGESESWKKLSEFPYKWDKSTLQSKQDPGEEFFAQLLADVGQRLHELGRDDLRGMPEQQAMSPNEIAMRERK
jgi:hypothetical protein